MKLPVRMTVGELIAKLSAFNDELPVMIDGYEGGMDFPWPPHVIRVKLENEEPSYCGRFYEDEDAEDGERTVYISRTEPR